MVERGIDGALPPTRVNEGDGPSPSSLPAAPPTSSSSTSSPLSSSLSSVTGCGASPARDGADAECAPPAKRARVSHEGSACLSKNGEPPSGEEAKTGKRGESVEAAEGVRPEPGGTEARDGVAPLPDEAAAARQREEERLRRIHLEEKQKQLYTSFLPPGMLNGFVSAALSLDASGTLSAAAGAAPSADASLVGCTYTPDSGVAEGSPVSRQPDGELASPSCLKASRDPQSPCDALLASDRESLLTFASLFHLLVSGRGIDARELQGAADADKREAEAAALGDGGDAETAMNGVQMSTGLRLNGDFVSAQRSESKSSNAWKEKVLEDDSFGERARETAVQMASSPLVFLRGRHSRELLVRRLLRQLRGEDAEGRKDGSAGASGAGSKTPPSSGVHPPPTVLFEAWMKALKIFLSFLTSSALVGSNAKALALVAVFELLLLLLSPEEGLPSSPSSSGACASRASPVAAANKASEGEGQPADGGPKGVGREGASRPVLDFNNFADLLVEFVRAVPLRQIGAVISFLERNKSSLIAAFRRKGRECLASGGSRQPDTAQAKRALQAAGAKVIGMVKSIEEPLMHANEKQYIFATMQRAEATPVVLDSPEAWSALSQFEAGEESPAFAASSSDRSRSKKTSGKVSPPQVAASGREAAAQSAKGHESEPKTEEKKGNDSLASGVGACSYTIYAAYGKALAFLQAPDLVLEQPADTVADVLSSLDTLLSYFQKHPAVASVNLATESRVPGVSTPSVAEGDPGESESRRAGDNLLLLSSSGNPHYLSAGAFRERVDTPFFRRELLASACVAFHFLGQAGPGLLEKRDKGDGDPSAAPQGAKAPAGAKKETGRPAGGETGVTAQRMQQKIRESYSALSDKTKKTLGALETRVWSLAAEAFKSPAHAVLPSGSSSRLPSLSCASLATSPPPGGASQASKLGAPAPAACAARRQASGGSFRRVSDSERKTNAVEKLLQTEQLWLCWKERNCFDSVLKPVGSDTLAFSAADVPPPALLPFAVQTALSTLNPQKGSEPKKGSAPQTSPLTRDGKGTEKNPREKTDKTQAKDNKGDAKNGKDSETRATTGPREEAAEEPKAEEKEDTDIPGKLLNEAQKLAKQAEMAKGSWWPEAPGGANKPRRDSAIMRRLVQWLHAWEAAESGSSDSSVPLSSAEPLSPSEETGDVAHAWRRGLAVPGPLNLLRQGEDWFTSDSRDSPANYDDLLFMDKLRVKLKDLVKKMDDDDNPDNDVEEEERSKHNPVFSLRLQRLFALFYGDAYVAMSYKDTKCEDLRQAIAEYDTTGLTARLGIIERAKRTDTCEFLEFA
ncbi:conserved hypothetical protein [Neospora caninum Liverpool]|uniref:Uncharacterized protein n=1 Tax=Neospora caninum (strain Liverpool) TaxID=572307 RepID=F0VBL0_NEOCL|nr:conserved hypothetical protein [Neospora caninum Liverpool]CBZ50994.1 conserved hypothetical protein [Neospora caninum Liverpool]|eukprot:XP_003881027.1 conserved hypothetical protein [Neospora caninum Liverpool]